MSDDTVRWDTIVGDVAEFCGSARYGHMVFEVLLLRGDDFDTHLLCTLQKLLKDK